MLPIQIIAPWCHSTWPCSTRPDIYPNNKSIIIILKWHPLSLVTFPHKSFLRREFDSLSICLHTKVRSHLQIEIKKSSVYSASIHSSIFFSKLSSNICNFLLLCCWHQAGMYFFQPVYFAFLLSDQLDSVFASFTKCDKKKETFICLPHHVSVHLWIKCLCVWELNNKTKVSHHICLYVCTSE